MRCIVCLLLGGLFVAGCAGSKATSGSSAGNSPATTQSNGKVIITPDNSPQGKVVQVNNDARFAVLKFPIGTVPPIGKNLNVYRQGLKVGELKVTGPQAEVNTVADITTGDVRSGDEVRSN
jgi:hypothetical protein